MRLEPEQLRRVFPFHLAIQASGAVAQVGDSLRRLVGEELVGTRWDRWLKVLRPLGVTSLDAALARGDALAVCAWVPTGMRLRGQFVRCGSGVLFLGTPWLDSLDDLARYGLTLADFSAVDGTQDLLLLVQTKESALADAARLAASLRAAKDAAESADRAKSMFLANMSHEIRTPLNGVLGMLSLMVEDELSPAQRERAETATRSAESLLAIVNDILDTSKIDAGMLTLEQVDFDLAVLLRDVVATHAPSASGRGLAIALELADDVPRRVRSDPTRLRQMLSNLLSNAVKFTERGSVRVTCAVEADEGEALRLRICVHDTGVGVSEATVSRLFQPFVQADVSTTRRFGGTGLGLSIVRKLARQMGGDAGGAGVEGAGSSFWFSLRVSRAAAKARPRRMPTAPCVMRRARPKVLLVEDNPVNRRVATQALARVECDVVEAGDGRAAVEACAAQRFDVVLMDCHMPVMDGVEATREIRRTLAHPPPIVALTANAHDGDRARCLEAGMVDFLSKPFRLNDLRAVVRRWADRGVSV